MGCTSGEHVVAGFKPAPRPLQTRAEARDYMLGHTTDTY